MGESSEGRRDSHGIGGDGKLVNIDIDTFHMVKDQWKIDNPAKPK